MSKECIHFFGPLCIPVYVAYYSIDQPCLIQLLHRSAVPDGAESRGLTSDVKVL